MVRVPEGEMESQTGSPLDSDTLTVMRVDRVSVTMRVACMGVVLPAVAVNENEVGERVGGLPPS